eukprot:COSAG04_NODE_3016_length_3275_cov_99.189742_3_plen_86_part_00
MYAFPLHAGMLSAGVSPGSHCWAGAARTLFWIDPGERIVVVAMTQALGAEQYRNRLGNVVYGALVDGEEGEWRQWLLPRQEQPRL